MPQDASLVPTPEPPRARPAVDSNVDRKAAFDRARKHTLLVRSLRLALPFCAVLMFASYGLFMQRSISVAWGDKKVEVDGISLSNQALVAHNPRYTGFDKQGGEFEVRAATA